MSRISTNPHNEFPAWLIALKGYDLQLTILGQYTSEEFRLLKAFMRSYYEQALAIRTALIDLAYLKNKTERHYHHQAEAYFSCFSSIVSSLHQHDIIQQKLNCIQRSTKEVIAQLQTSENKSWQAKEYALYNLTPSLPDIYSLLVGLLKVEKDYQSVSKEILVSLNDIEQHSRLLSTTIQQNLLPEEELQEAKCATDRAIAVVAELTAKFASEVNSFMERLKCQKAWNRTITDAYSQLSSIIA